MPPAEDESLSSRAPRAGLILMLIIVGGMLLLAVYANVQKARRDKIEEVIITPVSAASTTPSPRP